MNVRIVRIKNDNPSFTVKEEVVGTILEKKHLYRVI